MENEENRYAHIKGWGVDADPENEPTYPMKKYTGDDHRRLNYERPVQQISSEEILHSNERPSVSAVFGTSTPPSGLSGDIRRFAFRYSEGEWTHWLSLILADRVNAIEGIVDDIRQGHLPNIFAERGWAAEWKYNKAGVLKKVALGVALTTFFIAYSKTKTKKSSNIFKL
jgi:hypothetical protein